MAKPSKESATKGSDVPSTPIPLMMEAKPKMFVLFILHSPMGSNSPHSLRDFFGRVIPQANVPQKGYTLFSNPMPILIVVGHHCNFVLKFHATEKPLQEQKKACTQYKFHEGTTNAIRRKVYVTNFL
jgi:hypothetical protein